MMRPWALLLLAGCAHGARDPVLEARARVRRAAAAVAARDTSTVGSLVAPGVGRETPDRIAAVTATSGSELASTAAALRRAADGHGKAYAMAAVTGALGAALLLRHSTEGWRVDPESIGLPTPTPVAAIEQLIAALERLETDPSLLLLTTSLRDTIVSSSRERARALRESLPRVPSDATGRAPLQIDYGRGFFLVLKPDTGGWRIDDFN